VECFEDWLEAVDEGYNLDVIYLDFKKAFDSVPHLRLLRKMEVLGINGDLLKWCADFLQGRKQRVVLNGETSSWSDVLSGVPQGSVLGPTLFVIYINDMPDVVKSTIKLFADDAKIYRILKSPADDAEVLQADLRELEKWTTTWQMAFNPSKCQVMYIGHSNNRHGYILADMPVTATDEVRDLGVTLTTQLSMECNTLSKVKKANQVLGMLRRSFSHLDQKTLCLLYKALVRPHLEYCHVITHPLTERDMKNIEAVQRRATKQISALRDLPYEIRLQRLKLPSMRYRLLRGDLIQVYKYCHGMISPKPRSLTILRTATRGHSLKLEKKRCRTTRRLRSFPHRVIDTWNSLPEEVISAPSVNAFKQRVDKQLHHLQFLFADPRMQ
jgi:hypothetical protein